RVPLLVVQGRNDPRVPMAEAEQIVAAVRAHGVPVWYVIGTNEGHGFAKKANDEYQQSVEFLFLKRFLVDAPPEGAGRREPGTEPPRPLGEGRGEGCVTRVRDVALTPTLSRGALVSTSSR